MNGLTGLQEQDAAQLLRQYGKNVLKSAGTGRLQHIVLDVVKEPMFLLLSAACLLYFLLGQYTEGFMMMAAMAFVTTISIAQEMKSSKALQALRQLTAPRVKVVRGGEEKFILTEELVPGDVIVLSEGEKVPADAIIIQQNDLSINESILTGESLPVEKSAEEGKNLIYQGTLVNAGRCYARVLQTGNETELGKLGRSVLDYATSKTELQEKIADFVKWFALFGVAAFIIIFLFNFIHTQNAVTSLLFGLTLAMSAIPEEIPVAFSSFMALGAYHMSRLGIISRQSQVVENLGAVNVICLDKTGTITLNRMQVASVLQWQQNQLVPATFLPGQGVLYYAWLASERSPFDPMEIAIEEAYLEHYQVEAVPPLIFEYPLQGRPPMMTHVYEKDGNKLVAGKGALERILQITGLPVEAAEKMRESAAQMAQKGHRIIAVASARYAGSLPQEQDGFAWKMEGLLALYDPPRKNVRAVLEELYAARINVKLLTGDYSGTALTIADETGLRNNGSYLTGEEIMQMDDALLLQELDRVNVFARMFPEAKTRVVELMKSKGAIVAMTGDGVNDAPALKSANIGIAMGKKGTDLARQSADLILTDDNLAKLAEAVRQGRKIFNNLKKAVRYIISIHIPIILTASLPLILGWKYPNIFTPVHIIFLELIMGPTCSIFFEREPVEKDLMLQPPRNKTKNLFSRSEILISSLQGLAIAAGTMFLYARWMNRGYTIEATRSIVFTTLILANIFLTLVNRSFTETIVRTIRYPNNLAIPVVIVSVIFLALIQLLPFARSVFGISLISLKELMVCLLTAFLSVVWLELWKALRKPGRLDHAHNK